MDKVEEKEMVEIKKDFDERVLCIDESLKSDKELVHLSMITKQSIKDNGNTYAIAGGSHHDLVALIISIMDYNTELREVMIEAVSVYVTTGRKFNPRK